MFKQIPTYKSDSFHSSLIEFGHFLERSIRPGLKHDLKTYPNAFWQAIENRMYEGLNLFIATKAKPGQIIMLQWYNSGVFIKTSETIIGFDILAIPRYYAWPDNLSLTTKIAGMIDALFITHEHEDHFDKVLSAELLKQNKNVFIHSELAKGKMTGVKDKECFYFRNLEIIPQFATHVWRTMQNEVLLTAYEVTTADGFTFIFSGDADYTKNFISQTKKVDLLFITWRNPNSSYEDGHPDQKGTTIDAINIAIENIKPSRIILEHYGELDHIYKGFEASFDLAVKLIDELPATTDIFFWGDVTRLK